jgi:hypothetical protein
VNRALSLAFGFVMVAATAFAADDQALIAAALCALAVLVGSVFRPAATIAVLLAGAALVLDDAPALMAALAGLCATCYLVLRHTDAVSAPTVIGAVAFTTLALAAASVPSTLPWVPLVTPLTVLALVVFATRPFWADGSSAR